MYAQGIVKDCSFREELVPWKLDTFGKEGARKRENIVYEFARQADFRLLAIRLQFPVYSEVLTLQIGALPLSLGSLVTTYPFWQQHVGCRDASLSVQVFDFHSTVLSSICLRPERFIMLHAFLPYPFLRAMFWKVQYNHVELMLVTIKEAYRILRDICVSSIGNGRTWQSYGFEVMHSLSTGRGKVRKSM